MQDWQTHGRKRGVHNQELRKRDGHNLKLREKGIETMQERENEGKESRGGSEAPARGEVWLADLDPTRGHEQAGRRPVLVLSETLFNRGPAGLAVVLPITSRLRPIPSHVRLVPPEGGLRKESAVLCEAIRSISSERLSARLGEVRASTLAKVEDVVRILLGL